MADVAAERDTSRGETHGYDPEGCAARLDQSGEGNGDAPSCGAQKVRELATHPRKSSTAGAPVLRRHHAGAAGVDERQQGQRQRRCATAGEWVCLSVEESGGIGKRAARRPGIGRTARLRMRGGSGTPIAQRLITTTMKK